MKEATLGWVIIILGLLILSTIIVVSNQPLGNPTTTITACRALPQHVGFNDNTSAGYDNFEVDVFFQTCGQYSQYSDIHIIVSDVFINAPGLQNASRYAFSFENAYSYTPNECEISEPAIQQGVNVTLSQPAIQANSTNRYYQPPIYNGTGDLCFSYPGPFEPVFIVDFGQGNITTLHLNSYQTYQLDIAPLPENINIISLSFTNSTTFVSLAMQTAKVAYNGIMVVGVIGDFGLIALGVVAFLFPEKLVRLKRWLRKGTPPYEEDEVEGERWQDDE